MPVASMPILHHWLYLIEECYFHLSGRSFLGGGYSNKTMKIIHQGILRISLLEMLCCSL